MTAHCDSMGAAFNLEVGSSTADGGEGGIRSLPFLASHGDSYS